LKFIIQYSKKKKICQLLFFMEILTWRDWSSYIKLLLI
jgi:hypothetical protein